MNLNCNTSEQKNKMDVHNDIYPIVYALNFDTFRVVIREKSQEGKYNISVRCPYS